MKDRDQNFIDINIHVAAWKIPTMHVYMKFSIPITLWRERTELAKIYA